MSATDELRRMLDERGVEWTAPNSCLRDEMTGWAAGGFYYDAFEVPEPDGTFLLTASHQDDLTPEQAIAATLGGMKLYAVNTWSDLDDIGVSYIERRLYRTREEAEARAREIEFFEDGIEYYANVVEFEVVAE